MGARRPPGERQSTPHQSKSKSKFPVTASVGLKIREKMPTGLASSARSTAQERAQAVPSARGAGGLVGGRQGQRARTPDAARAEPRLGP